MLIDSHAHLEMEQFDPDRDEVLRRAFEAGVEAILAIGSGTGPGSLDCAIELARRYAGRPGVPKLFASIGIHPHEARLATDEDLLQLEQLAAAPEVIAWGEIGLDYFYDHSPREVQKDVFRRQIEAAKVAGLPIVIHCRPSDNSSDAWDDCLETIVCHWPRETGGILHCFTGTLEHATTAIHHGFLISFSGNVTFPKAIAVREAAAAVPLEKILIETDSPFLAPVPHRGKRNEPAFVARVAATIAQLRGLEEGFIAMQTAGNFKRFFMQDIKAKPVDN